MVCTQVPKPDNSDVQPKGLRSVHIRGIHIRNPICNTNKLERLNGGFAGRFRYIPAA